MTVEEVATVIQQNIANKRPILIGIEGFGGSGKSTIAQQLAEALGSAYVVSLDDFIVKSKLAEPSWDSGVFDRQRLETQVLRPISKDEPPSYQKLDWTSDTLSEPIHVPDVSYVIIEGITAYHPDIEQYYDYKIWIDTSIQIAKERGHARSGANENAQFWDLWADNDRTYMKQLRPKERADYVISN